MPNRVRWSPKAPVAWIARLYGLDAQGIEDEELLAKIGWRLCARCHSVLLASDHGLACPECESEFKPVWTDGDAECPQCGAVVTKAEWHVSVEHQDLLGGNAEGAFRRFEAAWQLATTYRERLLELDRLVHATHVSGNTACRNLFEGRRPRQLVEMLDAITAGSGGASVLARLR
jgi:ribosomal protein S27AE